MELSDVLKLIVDVLERLQLEYFITGSMASILFGEPRLTNDVDIVVALPLHRVHEFCSQFSPTEFYVSETAALEAVRSGKQFNIIHPASGIKADIIIPVDSPFNRSRFARRVRRPAGSQLEFDAVFSSPEDAILKKLEYYAQGGSEKHVRDITGILKVSGAKVNRDYIARWAAELHVSDVWQVVLERMGLHRN